MMEEFGRYMAGTTNFGGTRDIPHLVRSINRLYHYDDPRWSLIPATQKDIGNTLFMYEAGAAVPGVILEYMDLEGRTANFTVFYKDATGKTVEQAIAAAKAFVAAHPVKGVKASFAGGIIGTTAAANEETEISDLKMTVAIISLVTVAIAVAYQSVAAGVMVFVLLIICVMTNRAFMTVRDIGLNVNTLPVTSVGIGVGVDYAIYMLDRLKEEMRHRTLVDAIVTSMRTTGAAILFTGMTVMAGIIYWIPGSSLRFNSEMALLLCLLLTSNMIGAITLIPLWVRVFKPKFVMEFPRRRFRHRARPEARRLAGRRTGEDSRPLGGARSGPVSATGPAQRLFRRARENARHLLPLRHLVRDLARPTVAVTPCDHALRERHVLATHLDLEQGRHAVALRCVRQGHTTACDAWRWRRRTHTRCACRRACRR